MGVGTGGVAYATDFLVCRMHFPHDCTVGLGALICRYMEVWWSHMRSSFLRDAFDPGPTVSTRALTSRTERWPWCVQLQSRSEVKKTNRWKERMRETEWCRASTRGQTKQPIRRVGGTRPPGDRDLVTYQPTGHWGQDIPYKSRLRLLLPFPRPTDLPSSLPYKLAISPSESCKNVKVSQGLGQLSKLQHWPGEKEDRMSCQA